MVCKACLGLETSMRTICAIAQNLCFKKLWKKSKKMSLLAWPPWNEWHPNLFSTEFPSDDNEISNLASYLLNANTRNWLYMTRRHLADAAAAENISYANTLSMKMLTEEWLCVNLKKWRIWGHTPWPVRHRTEHCVTRTTPSPHCDTPAATSWIKVQREVIKPSSFCTSRQMLYHWFESYFNMVSWLKS